MFFTATVTEPAKQIRLNSGVSYMRVFIVTFALLGAGIRSLEPGVPPDPGDIAARVQGTLKKAPEWRKSFTGLARLFETDGGLQLDILGRSADEEVVSARLSDPGFPRRIPEGE